MKTKLLMALALSAGLSGVFSSGSAAPALPQVSPSIAQVAKLHESGVAPDVLLVYVKETSVTKPNADEVLFLTEKGVPKDVVVALLTKKVWSEPQQPARAATALPPAVQQTKPAQPAPTVVVQQPAPTVTYVAAPPVYYPRPYYPYYYNYNPWPSFAVGVGLGYGFGYWGHGGGHWGHGGHWGGGHHGGGGIHVHRR